MTNCPARWFWFAASVVIAIAGGLSSVTAHAADLPPVKLALIEGMSGPFANAGAMVERNLRFGVERVNAKGGVKLADGMHPLELVVLDGKGSSEASFMQLPAAIDDRIGFVMQGNSSAVPSALISTIDKQNAREPDRRVLFLNYSAADPALTNASCSYWHFRFDAHAGMRMDALADALQRDRAVKKVYLLNQDYSFLRSRREPRGAARDQRETAGYRDRRGRVSSDRPHEGFCAVHRQDPRERRRCGRHGKLGQ